MTAFASASPELSHRFAEFIEALCRCVAGEGAKNRIAGPFVVLVWMRLRRLASRFARLAAHPPAQRPDRSSGKSGARHDLPRGFGWLLRLMPGTAAIASRFRYLLDDPEMAELIAATPSSARILRPLCHTLGIRPPPALRLPPRPRARHHTASDEPDPAPSPASPPPSPFASPPDLPGWPRAPGAARFYRGRAKIRVRHPAPVRP